MGEGGGGGGGRPYQIGDLEQGVTPEPRCSNVVTRMDTPKSEIRE